MQIVGGFSSNNMETLASSIQRYVKERDLVIQQIQLTSGGMHYALVVFVPREGSYEKNK